MEIHGKMGEVAYSADGRIQCHICGEHFKKPMTHVVQKHGMTAYEYKKTFGLNTTHGLASQDTRELLQASSRKHSDLMYRNIIQNGKKSRFKKGSGGRPKEMLSLQEYNRLIEYVKTNIPYEVRQKNMSELGKTGMGNIAKYQIVNNVKHFDCENCNADESIKVHHVFDGKENKVQVDKCTNCGHKYSFKEICDIIIKNS